MEKGGVSCQSIDIDSRWWGYSHTNEGWVFGYKLHIISTITTTTKIADSLIVPIASAADVTTTANVPDNYMYFL